MRIHSAGVLSAALVAGMAGSVAAYRAQIAEAPAVHTTTTTAVVRAPQPVKQGIRYRWAPCPRGSQLEQGVCVTDVVRTVVVPAAAAPVDVPAPAFAAGTGDAASNGQEDAGAVGYDDRDGAEQDEPDQGEPDQDQHGQAEHEDDD